MFPYGFYEIFKNIFLIKNRWLLQVFIYSQQPTRLLKTDWSKVPLKILQI